MAVILPWSSLVNSRAHFDHRICFSILGPSTSDPSRPRHRLEDIKQDTKELYVPTSAAKVDIVFVPGLATDPEISWKSNKGDFNWISHQDGIVRDFTKARALLYQYESSWKGPLQVKQFMHNIASTLLTCLNTLREGCERRPIVFVAHSMGGLVVAKAVTLTDSRQDRCGTMFESIAGCIFFGTPFHGAHAAAAAHMLSTIGARFDLAIPSKLLDMMKPGDESLTELRNEFARLAGKLSQKIQLFYFWEEQPTDFAKQAKLPSFFSLAVPKTVSELVSRESATLEDVDGMGLACTHQESVEFDSARDGRYQLVPDPLKKIIHGASLVVKNRFNSTRNISRETIKDVLTTLDAAQVHKKLKALREEYTRSFWLAQAQEYKEWLAEDLAVDCLWIRGPEGRGKTSREQQQSTGQEPVLLAYFFCTPTGDSSTAEDLLKSLLSQLVDKQEILVSYAKGFVKEEAKSSRPAPKMTVDNMWQSLQEMLWDEFIGRPVYFIINNLHALAEDSDSTKKLMKLINTELASMKTVDQKRAPVRWLFTSRELHSVENALKVDGVRLIDLEDPKYGNQVQRELLKYAYTTVKNLREEKKYTKAVSYFAHSLIDKRAQNTQWADIACVRRILEAMPQELNLLLERAWKKVFASNYQNMDRIKEMLRALVLTSEDPTEPELGRSELRQLVEKCKPLLTMRRFDRTGFFKISFINVVHGVLAFRSFSHLIERLNFPESENKTLDASAPGDDERDIPSPQGVPEDAVHGSNTVPGHVNDASDSPSPVSDHVENLHEDLNASEADEGDNDSYSNGYSSDASGDESPPDPELETILGVVLGYMVKHWLDHASHATAEIASDLVEEGDFWKQGSPIHRRWLKAYEHFASWFNAFDYESNILELSALHVAASIGFPRLVAELIKGGHQNELHLRDKLSNTPLHFAAYFGRDDIVEELLNCGAPIDDGVEIGTQTPLHMVAFQGNVKTMRKLIDHKADINATTKKDDIGPVVNAAICSSNHEAVKILAAQFADMKIFKYLVEACADKLRPEEYSTALIAAANSGGVEVFKELLSYEHPQECFQKVLEAATEEENWGVVNILLDKCAGLDCDKLFIAAVDVNENQDKVLQAVWQYTNGSVSGAKESTVKLLLDEFEADPNATGEMYGNALTAAAHDGTIRIVRMLLEKEADVNSEHGWALQTAAAEGHLEVVEELLAQGAYVDACTRSQYFPPGTALQAACESCKPDIADILLEKNANPNLRPRPDTCPLIAAASRGEARMVKLLVEAGAEVNVFGGPNNATPLLYAAICLPVESLRLLLLANADINLADGNGDTALIVAAQRGDQQCVRFLTEEGADVMHSNKSGENALHAMKVAIESENEAVAGVFRNIINNQQGTKHSKLNDENSGEDEGRNFSEDECEGERPEDEGSRHGSVSEMGAGGGDNEDNGDGSHQEDDDNDRFEVRKALDRGFGRVQRLFN
ncbi:ankyrin repeat-containing domain protein [Pseudomassariella vexata]|uniref:Ankyrin repeat-containing domain protein n=1 Tax=Pseudomassariella vexata TaxID=1141098 RepID=A0A1Y2DQ86_9PEZI|nr:ankyrin repeat-containing domain protein [Pseudomassariella vexata]ORY61452.1 ankyrin repeat-containing domain protein [Pseudomassariella vexata]